MGFLEFRVFKNGWIRAVGFLLWVSMLRLCLGFGVWGLGFGVSALGFKVWGLGFRV